MELGIPIAILFHPVLSKSVAKAGLCMRSSIVGALRGRILGPGDAIRDDMIHGIRGRWNDGVAIKPVWRATESDATFCERS